VDRLKAMGLFSEIVSWKLRLFVPDDVVAGSAGARAIVRTASAWRASPTGRLPDMSRLSTRAADLSERLAQMRAGRLPPLSARRQARRPLLDGRRRCWDAPGRSLYVRLFETERGRIGNWVDAATGEHGDLVDLIRLNQRHGRLADTID
jgi:hypothetical protein